MYLPPPPHVPLRRSSRPPCYTAPNTSTLVSAQELPYFLHVSRSAEEPMSVYSKSARFILWSPARKRPHPSAPINARKTRSKHRIIVRNLMDTCCAIHHASARKQFMQKHYEPL
ncbi:hypothetical protein Micbo1qcDRAFT_2603 [Microdochium bolleyi]|uniref:Uncharacterized protein n=1 Tax=Microdochium bolleyi TaxID=196109 RepID=A0A136JHU9_9PEZI|nr:hypothetical protein Micbo1qcDRAFT_2603 [Microdochium bolleyi]